MIATAFDTQPSYEKDDSTSNQSNQSVSSNRRNVESLDTDSVLQFLSHLGISHHTAHQRIADTLLKQLEDEIKKADDKSLLDLLADSWPYIVGRRLSNLRPIIWTILKKLGEKTPPLVLQALAERDEEGGLKNKELLTPLPHLIHQLVWETDWKERIPSVSEVEPNEYLEQVSGTVLFQTMNPYITQYCTNKLLVQSASLPFVSSTRDRKIVTTQRRALTATVAAPSMTGAASLIRGKHPTPNMPRESSLSSGNAIAQLRSILTGSSDSKTVYRPNLLYALLSVLMGKHGSQKETFLGGPDFLHCTLASDILLSAGGPLPKSYHHVHSLARTLDQCVQEGNITDEGIIKIQNLVRHIFQPDIAANEPDTLNKKKETESIEATISNATQRQLNHILTDAISVMKEADPQSLFLNPVTDRIAPNYSKVIKKPMCISMMEEKVKKDLYHSADDFEQDVKLMFKNCIDYNRGEAGKWFRDEALRQSKVFRDEIFPQARKYFKDELVKKQHELVSSRKRTIEDVVELTPLSPSVKKRKKDQQDDMGLSMPALASMLMADPFFVRIVLARILKDLRLGVIAGGSLPVAHRAIPSLLQFLHLARFSSKVCGTRGKRFIVPGGGIDSVEIVDDAINFVPFATLRKDLPLLLRLLVEAELDKRIMVGEDLYEADQSSNALRPPPIDHSQWEANEQMEVAVSLIEGSLVHLCQPGNATEASLATTFEKFAETLRHVAISLPHHRLFFKCLVAAIVRHKAKLTKAARDVIVKCWLEWLRSFGKGIATSAAHECFVLLLNEWSTLGNLVLPRDTLLEFAKEGVAAVSEAESPDNDKKLFGTLWNTDDASFVDVRKQYNRMLRLLSASQAEEWKKQVGIVVSEDDTETVD
jgi:bromodomain-containing protein 7/9